MNLNPVTGVSFRSIAPGIASAPVALASLQTGPNVRLYYNNGVTWDSVIAQFGGPGYGNFIFDVNHTGTGTPSAATWRLNTTNLRVGNSSWIASWPMNFAVFHHDVGFPAWTDQHIMWMYAEQEDNATFPWTYGVDGPLATFTDTFTAAFSGRPGSGQSPLAINFTDESGDVRTTTFDTNPAGT
jgi:hypothetical protein